MDLGAAVDAFGDPAGKLARRHLAPPAEIEDRLAQRRDDADLHRQHHDGDAAQPPALAEDEDQGSQGLAPQEGGLDEGVETGSSFP